MADSRQPSLIGSVASSTKSLYVPRLVDSLLLQSNSTFSAPAPEVYLARPRTSIRSLEQSLPYFSHQKTRKRLYWAVGLSQLSLISSTVALVLLAQKSAVQSSKSTLLIAWFTASSLVTIALALTVGIMWKQRRKRRWMQRKPSILGSEKQDEIHPQDTMARSGRKRTFFNRLMNSSSQVNVARNTPMSETDQPPKTPPCSRRAPTSRDSVSPARTMDSDSSLAGEGYELHYIRSALSSPSEELPPSPARSVDTPRRPNPVRLPPLRTDSHTLRHGYKSSVSLDNSPLESRFGPAIIDDDGDEVQRMGPPPASPAGSAGGCSDGELYRRSTKPVPPLLLHERSWLALSAREDVSPLDNHHCGYNCPYSRHNGRRNYSPPSGLGSPNEINSLYAQLSAAFGNPKHRNRHRNHRHAHSYDQPFAPELTSRFSPGSTSASSSSGPASPASSSPPSDEPSVAASLDMLSPIVYGVGVARDVEVFSAPRSMISLETLPVPPPQSSSKVNLSEAGASRMTATSVSASPALSQSRPQTALQLSLSSRSRFVDAEEQQRPAAWDRSGRPNEVDEADNFFVGLANSPPSSPSMCLETTAPDTEFHGGSDYHEDVWPRHTSSAVALPLAGCTNSYSPAASAASLPHSAQTAFGTPSIGAPLARQAAVPRLGPPFSPRSTTPDKRGRRGISKTLSGVVQGLSLWNKGKVGGSANGERRQAGFL